jgi:predicted ATPase/DNA-binding SARP family transcriptional activator
VEMLEVKLMGMFDIRYDGKSVFISSRAAQSLFVYLILNAGTLYRRKKLAGMFWPDATEEKARAYIRHELWRIRTTLSSSEFLISNDIGVAFDSSADYWLDVQALEKLTGAVTVDDLMTGLSHYTGELLPGFYDEWIIIEREHLQSVYERGMARLLELLESQRRWQDILEWAERWISLGHAPEAAFRALMHAYYELGHHSKVASTYERCVHGLAELGLEPSDETRALALKQTSTLNIPVPLTSFIGREKELTEIAGLLSKSRLVTLTGSGGVGKTRLAIQVVAEVLNLFPDGIWFFDLAFLNDAERVPNALTSVLGLRHTNDSMPFMLDILTGYLRSRTALLIFDNCEHLIEPCAELAGSLLQACQNLHILATSREAFRIAGEIPYRVPSLEIPKPDSKLTLNMLVKIEAVRLFVERAAAISPVFAIGLGLEDARIIAQICWRLDGIPLAIELAAARAEMLTVKQILKRLDDRFEFLTRGSHTTPPRHQTLRATIEWSYDLLSEQERILFRRLAVFVGGWTLEAAEEVCSGSGIHPSSVLDLLGQIVNKSLVVVETPNKGETRYRRLETIRQFAREKLFETPEAAQVQGRHLSYFLKKAEEIEPHLMDAEQSKWVDYLDLELDNIRLALEWSITNKMGEEALRLFGALGWFWHIRCHFQEGRDWVMRAIALKDKASKSAQARALRYAGNLYWANEDYSASIIFLRESLDLYRELGDMKEVSTVLQALGVVEFARGDYGQARATLEESLSISRKVNNTAAMPRVLMHLAQFARMKEDYAAAWQYLHESLAICRQVQDDHLTTVVLQSMGDFALEQRNNLKAREYVQEALMICLKLKNKRTTAHSLLGLADALCAEARYAQSARLQGFVLTLFQEAESLTESRFTEIEKTADILRLHLGDASYQKEFDLGKTLQLEQAIQIALEPGE